MGDCTGGGADSRASAASVHLHMKRSLSSQRLSGKAHLTIVSSLKHGRAVLSLYELQWQEKPLYWAFFCIIRWLSVIYYGVTLALVEVAISGKV